MKLKSAIAGLAAAGLLAFGAAASAQTLTIINSISSDITAIYISSSATDNWEENIIPDGYVLPSGNQIDVQINGQYDQFDLRVEAGDASEDYTGYPGNTTAIEIQGAGNTQYQ